MKIGELAAATGVPVETLRFYELEMRSADVGADEGQQHIPIALKHQPAPIASPSEKL